MSERLPSALLEYFIDKRLKVTFFPSASTFTWPTMPTFILDNHPASPLFPRIPLDNPWRTGVNLLHPAELRILYVWVEAAITIEIVGDRELKFSTQEKMSHTPTQNTASLVVCCRWRYGYLCLFFASKSVCKTAGRERGAAKRSICLELTDKDQAWTADNYWSIWRETVWTLHAVSHIIPQMYLKMHLSHLQPCKQLCQAVHADSELTVRMCGNSASQLAHWQAHTLKESGCLLKNEMNDFSFKIWKPLCRIQLCNLLRIPNPNLLRC